MSFWGLPSRWMMHAILFYNYFSEEDFSSIRPNYELAISSLGALKIYLKRCKIDHEIFSMANIKMYVPPDLKLTAKVKQKSSSKNLILDSGALMSLQITKHQNMADEGFDSLYDVINFCKTGFGQRLLKKWLMSPLSDLKEINARLEVIKKLKSTI